MACTVTILCLFSGTHRFTPKTPVDFWGARLKRKDIGFPIRVAQVSVRITEVTTSGFKAMLADSQTSTIGFMRRPLARFCFVFVFVFFWGGGGSMGLA